MDSKRISPEVETPKTPASQASPALLMLLEAWPKPEDRHSKGKDATRVSKKALAMLVDGRP